MLQNFHFSKEQLLIHHELTCPHSYWSSAAAMSCCLKFPEVRCHAIDWLAQDPCSHTSLPACPSASLPVLSPDCMLLPEQPTERSTSLSLASPRQTLYTKLMRCRMLNGMNSTSSLSDFFPGQIACKEKGCKDAEREEAEMCTWQSLWDRQTLFDIITLSASLS